MISYEIYKFIHLVGLTITVFSLGAMALQMALQRSADFKYRKLIASGHGIGALLLLLGGFGMLARLGIVQNMPTWVYIKIAIWLVVGALIVPMKRKPQYSSWLWALTIILVAAAAWTAIFKPFL